MAETDWIGTIGGILGIDPALIESVREQQKIDHLDFHETCHVRTEVVLFGDVIRESEPCGKPALWVGSCTRCGTPAACCDPHRTELFADLKARCRRCGATGPGASLFELTSIGGAA